MTEGITRLENKVVLITGAAGGIGRAICVRLAFEGASVIATDLDRERCAELVETLDEPARHLARELDIADESGWTATTEAIKDRYCGLDAVVNNGAIGSFASVVDETLDAFDHVVNVGQTGTWLGMKHAGALIERTGGGSVVNMCSILGTVGGLGSNVAYAAAKGAVRTMTKNAALYWADKGVRVNSVHPGFIGTDQLISRYDGTDKLRNMLARTPMGRLGGVHEVAAAIAFLASDDSTFITGSELYVDGGWTAA